MSQYEVWSTSYMYETKPTQVTNNKVLIEQNKEKLPWETTQKETDHYKYEPFLNMEDKVPRTQMMENYCHSKAPLLNNVNNDLIGRDTYNMKYQDDEMMPYMIHRNMPTGHHPLALPKNKQVLNALMNDFPDRPNIYNGTIFQPQ
jgi:hypothetical protein